MARGMLTDYKRVSPGVYQNSQGQVMKPRGGRMPQQNAPQVMQKGPLPANAPAPQPQNMTQSMPGTAPTGPNGMPQARNLQGIQNMMGQGGFDMQRMQQDPAYMQNAPAGSAAGQAVAQYRNQTGGFVPPQQGSGQQAGQQLGQNIPGAGQMAGNPFMSRNQKVTGY